MESKYERVLFASQIFTSLSDSSFELVEPLINHNNSSTTPRQNTHFVVNKGKTPEVKQIHNFMNKQ